MSIPPLFCSSFNLRSFQLPSPHGRPGQNFSPFFPSDLRSDAFLHFRSHSLFLQILFYPPKNATAIIQSPINQEASHWSLWMWVCSFFPHVSVVCVWTRFSLFKPLFLHLEWLKVWGACWALSIQITYCNQNPSKKKETWTFPDD